MDHNGKPDQHWVPSPPSNPPSKSLVLFRPEHLQERVGTILADGDIFQ